MTGDGGWAGASARREAERLRREREAAPSMFRGRSRDAAAWERGAEGEELVGAILDDLPGVLVLHDRGMPGRSANIDHIAVASSGVYVIDAKHYAGQPRTDAGRLFLGRDDRTALVDAVRRQVGAVAAVLGDAGAPAHGVLCFVGADWSIGNGFLLDGIGITAPDRLPALLGAPGPLDRVRLEAIHRRLAAGLAAAGPVG